jgi:hypothetical protein
MTRIRLDELLAFEGLDAVGIAIGSVFPTEADMGIAG